MRVLVAEDEALIRLLLAEALSDYAYEVFEAIDGQDALERWAAIGPFDALITDIRMPRMSGDELAVRLRRQHPDLPIVVVSGYGSLEAERQLHRLGGALCILRKPALTEEIVRVLEQLVASGAPRPPERQHGRPDDPTR